MFLTNFEKSSISWFGNSDGKFKICSILKYTNNKETFALSEAVLAGNVYSLNNLIKNPPYLFQIIGNNENQKILRTDLPKNKFESKKNFLQRNKIKDTESGKLFENFSLIIKKKKYVKCLNNKEVINYFNQSFFVARLRLKNFKNTNVSIEFPINHINVSKKLKIWQVETGPVLFPICDGKEEKKLLPSFIMFNSFDQADVFYDYPYGLRKDYRYLKKIRCEIEIFAYKI